jgi:4-hydroxysphinganine ceramide fatty acyl 2-hydroxylase
MQYKITPKDAPQLAPHYHGPEVEDPVYRQTIARMFRSDLVEFFSKVHPLVPAALYLPVAWFAMRAALGGLGVFAVAGGIAAGLFFWSFAEYVLHRFVFHLPLAGPFSKFIYFQSHGIHHQYPDDFYRLLMVPPVSAPLAAAFYGLFALALPAPWAAATFAGFVLGYLAYDYTHFAVHFMKPPRSVWLAPFTLWFKAARRRHMVHHFDTHDRGYGVSTGLWDHVFGTVAEEK